MTTFRVNFNNETDRTWTMSVFQEIPASAGLDTVSWKQVTVPRSGFGDVQWQTQFNVVLGNLQRVGGKGVYRPSQILAAEPGTAWNIFFEDNVQQLQAAGSSGQPDQILIRNQSGRTANPGFGEDGNAAGFQPDTVSGSDAPFLVKPTYFVGLFNDVIEGEIIRGNVTVGPLELAFPTGQTTANVTANLDGQSIVLSVTYGDSARVSLDVVDERIGALDEFQRQAAA